MTLKTSSQLAGEGHGFRPFAYRVEFSTSSSPTEFASDDAPAAERLAQLRSVSLGYGTGDFAAKFLMHDPDTAQTTTEGATDGAYLEPARNGERVRIYVETPDAGELLQFKGTVHAVHERRVENGIEYECEALSEVRRLNDTHVTMSFNLRSDPLRPAPRFDATGNLVDNTPKTVKEIIDAILDFSDAWGTTEFFTSDSMDWDGLDDDPRCGAFIPSQVSFDNTPKGKAIEDVLSRAGNFALFYDPVDDTLRVTERNLRCDRCGDQWDLRFPHRDDDEISDGDKYAYEVDVREDSTTWNSRQTANVCRIVGGPIRWYSGHNIIPERVATLARDASGAYRKSAGNYVYTDDEDAHTVTDRQDTEEKQAARAVNFEGANYRFFDTTQVTKDRRTLRRFWVGMSLFPDWNVHADFLPAPFEILDVKLPDQWFKANGAISVHAPTINGSKRVTREAYKAQYRGQMEWNNLLVGDMLIRGDKHQDRLDNLRAFQLWYATETCPACLGSGAVEEVYSGAINEPDVEWVEIAGRFVPKITNYHFDPAKFGTRDPATVTEENPEGTLYSHGMLRPYTGWKTYAGPQDNLCPYCRGVGLKPEWKVRNISPDLAAGRNQKATAQEPNGATEDDVVNLDPDAISTGPESWADSQNRMVVNLPPLITQEVAGPNVPLPGASSPRMTNLPLAVVAGSNNPHGFMHPAHRIDDSTGNYRMSTATGGTKELAEDTERAYVNFTMVQMGTNTGYRIDWKMGRVIFSNQIFIPCKKSFETFQVSPKGNCHMVHPKGHLALNTTEWTRGKTGDLPTGFWRAPRVWIQCFYMREGFYDPLEDQETQTVSVETAEGDTENYQTRAMIVDGRYCLEVVKVDPDSEEGDIEMGTGSRMIQVNLTDPDATVEVYPADFFADPTPPEADMEDSAYETYKSDEANYAFPRGKMLLWQGASVGERLLSSGSIVDIDYFDSTVRPRQYSWRLKDDRSRMLGKAVRSLESQNNIQVTGSLTVVGVQQHLRDGLGYVYYPGRGLASVERTTLQFGSEFTASLELTRRQARFGELVPKDEERIHTIQRNVTRLASLVEATRGAVTNGTGTSGDQHSGRRGSSLNE